MKINGAAMLKCFAALFFMLSRVGAKPTRYEDISGLASLLDMGAGAYHERSVSYTHLTLPTIE